MKLIIRRENDIDILMLWRLEVLRAVFGIDPSPELLAANRAYYEKHIPACTHLAFVAHADGAPAGCGAVCLTEELPSPDNPSGRCAYVMNIYVRPPFRSRGIGHAVVRRLVDVAKKLACQKIYLETTARARPLYIGIGFRDMDGMMKYADIHNRQS